jgi:hypothetical protein
MAKIARSTGCVNAPSKLIDPAPTLAAIEQFLARSGTRWSSFGRDAVRDPRLVSDLRAGRTITENRAARVLAYIQMMEAAHA